MLGAALEYTYFVQPTAVAAIVPRGGRLRGGTRVTIHGDGFAAHAGASASEARVGWGDTYAPRMSPMASRT
jgi:hypothetical protein